MTFSPELGQAAFGGTPWHKHNTPSYVTAGFDVLASLIASRRGDHPDNVLTCNMGAEDYVNDVFAMRTYCWCDNNREGHEEGCPPNFEHFKSGIEATWYKHSERGESISREVLPEEWASVLAECMASVAHDAKGDATERYWRDRAEREAAVREGTE